MTRTQIEVEVMQLLGLVSQAGVNNADANIRLYVQGKIQGVIDKLTQEHKFTFRRKSFSVYLAAPLTGTITATLGTKTGTVSGQTPDNTWVGGHVVVASNGFPLMIESVSGQVLTFVQPVMAALSGTAFTVYFDGALMPTDCQTMMQGTVKIEGGTSLAYRNKEDFEHYMSAGWANSSSDYGQTQRGGRLYTAISSPSVGQPYVYTSWRSITLSNVTRRVLNVYPYPDIAYAISWDGWRKPIAITVTGTATGDSDVPDLPEDFHRTLLVPQVKLDMCEYPGFELSSTEIQALQIQVSAAMKNFYSEQMQDENEIEPWRPGVM